MKVLPRFIAFVAVLCPCLVSAANAQNPVAGYFENWFLRVTKAQAEQPHWITPLFTTTPRLEEEFRSE